MQGKRKKIVAEMERLGAARAPLGIGDIEAMRPGTEERPFSNPEWYFELKYDGFRMLAERRQGRPCLVDRGKRDITAVFPEIARAVASLPYDLILDGEAVVPDETGRPSLQSLQRRARHTRPIDCEQAAVAAPATLFAFDLLALEGFDVRPLPLSARKSLLRRVLEESGPPAAIRCIEGIPERGEDLYAAVTGLGLEGIVAKRADSPYRGGYSDHWRRIPVAAPLPPIRLTNLGKVFWPEEGYTKRDLIEYYRSVAPWMLPFLRDRPLVIDRYPNGITGKSFFQKNAAEITSGRLRTVPVRGESSQREIEYFLCDDEDSLLYLANKGSIALHVWSSRLPDLERPDWCILDLDPKGAPFDHVARIALAIRGLCEEIALPSFAKTSGGSGLHVLLPMGRQLDHERVRQLGELLARVVIGRLPDIATTARAISARQGKVYVDALQNGRGKLLAAPYSARALPGATVSTPLRWSEVGPRLDVRRFTIRTVPERLRGMEEDPLLPVLDARPDLARSLELLSSRV